MSRFQPMIDSPPARRLRARMAMWTLALAWAGTAFGQPLKRYDTLSLKDGRQLSAVQIVTYTTTDVLVRHAQGATSLRVEVLPDQLIADLHLPTPLTAQAIAADPAFLALAEKAAVADPAAAPASLAAGLVAPATAQPALASAPVVDADSNVSAEQLAAAARPVALSTSAPAGEGNVEFAAAPRATAPLAASPRHDHEALAGRIAIALPTGETHLLADVEVRAYPADLLARGLLEARARSAELARPLHEQAAAEAQAGRLAESAALTARAERAAAQYLEFLPPAPYSTRSDAYGHFTLTHWLRDARLVAVGRINVPQGEWAYAWVGVAADQESLLTEANATTVTAPEAGGTRVAAR